MSWNAQSRHALSVQSNNQEPNPLEVFSQHLKQYLWDNLDVDKLKNLRRQAREVGPEAVILLLNSLSKKLTEMQLKKLNIEETYSSFIGWAFQEAHSALIVFLTDPNTRQKLFLSNSSEQHIKLIDRCLAENSIALATFFTNKFIDSIDSAKALEFFHEAFNKTNMIKDYRDFDTIAYTLLQNKKILHNDVVKLAKKIPLQKFLIDLQCYKTILQCLDVAQFDPNLFWKESNLTLVELAAELGNENAIKSLLDKGANIKSDNDFLSRPPRALQLATQYGHINIVKILLEKGVNINAKDQDDHSALYYAIEIGNDALIKLLEDKGATPIEFSDHHLNYKLTMYLKNKNNVAVKYVITHATPLEILYFKDSQGKFLIHNFAERGDIENLKLVFAKFIQFKKTPKNDFPSEQELELTQLKLSDYLNKLASGQNTALHIATIYRHIDIIRILLANGADANIADRHGRTALHYAVKFDKLKIAEMLLANEENPSNKANPNVKDKEGNTPLHYAVTTKNEDSVRLLLRYNADPNIKNQQEYKPSDLAENNSAIKSILETKEEKIKELKIAGKTLAQNGSKDIFISSSVKVSKQASEKLGKEIETAEDYKNSFL